MDDFGSILERDYGFHRHGRTGRKKSSGSKINNSRKDAEYQENIRNNKLQEFPYRVQPSGYGGGRLGDSFGSSHSLYDEIFSCNILSTIPYFEDVFSSSRSKVSEFRDNDILKGIPVFKKTSSRVTYEDIFHESPPDDPSSLFVFTDALGSRVATSSRASSSGRQSPAQFKRESTTSSRSSPRPAEARNGGPITSVPKVHGSFLAMFRDNEANGFDKERPNHVLESSTSVDSVSANGIPRSWVTVDSVSLVTKATENPPPIRLAPASVDKPHEEEEILETAKEASGPPPVRSPPLINDDKRRHSRVPSLDQVLKNRCMVEESITEKVLAWQRQNLVQQEQQMLETSEKMQSQESQRSMSLDRYREKRTSIEKIVAEVQRESAGFAQARAERAISENMERDARATIVRQEDMPKEETVVEQPCQVEAFANEPEHVEAVNNEDLHEASSLNREEQDHLKDDHAEEVDTQVLTTDKGSSEDSENILQRDNSGNEDTKPDKVQSESPDQTSGRLSNSSYAESSIGIDTISSVEATDNGEQPQQEQPVAQNKDQMEEEPAPETPERLESKKLEKASSEEAIEAAWKEDGQKLAEEGRAKLETRENIERTLVARITAEVRQRAALEAKAKAEEQAKLAKVKTVERRTKPRLREGNGTMTEVVAEKLQRDNSSGSSSRSLASRVSLRDQLAKERQVRIKESGKDATKDASTTKDVPAPTSQAEIEAQRLRERSLVERITAEVRERAAATLAEKAAAAKIEEENEEMRKLAEKRDKAEKDKAREKEMLEKLDKERLEKARLAEKERLEKVEKARLAEKERLEKLEREREQREAEREREIEREKDRASRRIAEQNTRDQREKLAEAIAKEQAERIKMERAAVERATSEARERAKNAAYEKANGNFSDGKSRSASVPRHSVSMPTSGTQNTSENAGYRRTISSTNDSPSPRDFQETPERRKARLERHQRTMDRAAKALAQKNQRDMELQSEQAERQRLAERLNIDIKRWSIGKEGNIRALLSTLQYVLTPDSGWKQVSLTDLISSAAVKKAYRRAALCVHPDKMQQKHASVQEKYIAEKVFHILQVAWNKFNSQESI